MGRRQSITHKAALTLSSSVKLERCGFESSTLDMAAALHFRCDMTFVKIGHGRRCHILSGSVEGNKKYPVRFVLNHNGQQD